MNSIWLRQLVRLCTIVKGCQYPDLEFTVELAPSVAEAKAAGLCPQIYLRVVCHKGSCNVTGEPLSWKGRKWRLSVHMTDGEVVQTAFMALMTALEHEARERFKFCGATVFQPHFDIWKLVTLASDPNATAHRVDGDPDS